MNENVIEQQDIIEDLAVRRSDWAWTYLSLGNLQEAARLGRLENDIVVWAASLALSGDSLHALYIIESYIISTCETVAELFNNKSKKESVSSAKETPLQKRNTCLTKWLTTRLYGTRTNYGKRANETQTSDTFGHHTRGPDSDTDQQDIFFQNCRSVILKVMKLVNWRVLHLWYIIALTLLDNTNTKDPYIAPVNNIWFRFFFAFLHTDVHRSDEVFTNFDYDVKSLTQQKTLEIFLSQCSEWEAVFVSSLTAFYTHHYRTSIKYALQFWNIVTQGTNTTNGSCCSIVKIPDVQFYRVSMLVVRCCALLELGLRSEAAECITSLMRERFEGNGTSSEYVFMFGCALALYGMPLRDVTEPLNNFLKISDKVTIAPLPARVHILSTVYYVHALTLLQLGQMGQVAIITKMALSFNPPKQLREALKNITLRACVAQEDSTTILRMSITEPDQLLYLSLCPAFFGGLLPTGISAGRKTPLFRLLYPKDLPLSTSIRQLLPFYMNRAFFLFHCRYYSEAWDNICCAVELADEIAGSTEFAFTGCFPLHVYYFACKIGFTTLEYFLRKDIEKSLVDVDSSINSNPLSILRLMSFSERNQSRTSLMSMDRSTVESTLCEFDDTFMVQIIDLCRYCVQKIYIYYPHSVLGDVAAAQVAVMSYDPNSVPRAILLSRRYPHIILAQTTWALALFFDNKVSNAMDASQKVFQDFPHSSEVVATQKWIGLKGITYTFYYRGLFPVNYGPGSPSRRFTKRFFVSIILIAVNWIFLIIMFLINKTSYRPFRISGDLEVVLTVPGTWTFFLAPVFLVYAFIMAITRQNLVQTLLEELHFCQYSLTRFIFVMRSIVMINTANLLQVIFSSKWGLTDNSLLIALLFIFLIILTMPFTTRLWFLPSVDEPEIKWTLWISLFLVDAMTYPIVVIFHVILVLLEPLMSFVFFCVVPTIELRIANDAASIRRKLLYHQKSRYTQLQSNTNRGGTFIFIQIMKALYYQTHANMFSKNLEKSQIESEGYRVFPLIDEVLAMNIPLDHSWLDISVVEFYLQSHLHADSGNTSPTSLANESPFVVSHCAHELPTSPTTVNSPTLRWESSSPISPSQSLRFIKKPKSLVLEATSIAESIWNMFLLHQCKTMGKLSAAELQRILNSHAH